MLLLLLSSLHSIFLSPCYAEADTAPTILFLGDSLTEGYGIAKDKSFPVIAQKKLKEKGIDIKVVNGSVSGSTSASGISRLKWFSKARPDWVFLALGANDGLRLIKVEETQNNLGKVIALAKEKGIGVFLAGMMAPPNYGEEYTKAFQEIYANLKKEYDVPLLPFLLEGVAGEREFNQEDGIHPNVKGHELMGAKVADFMAAYLKKS